MPYIKKIHLHGFKSFAKPTDLVFGKGMNVIVGPNGAGKSNLADAICFVLGRLKVRTMRATKAANLIYDGGKENKPAPNAKVSMVFDNTDRVFSFPTDEVEITRIVKRDGTSIYKINNETKTRQEILELLAQAGVDAEGFNIILQGEINNIINMHPEEKRQIIEETAGISVYEERKEKALHELEKVHEKLKEIGIILTQRQGFLNNLEKEKAQAEKYEKLKNAIRVDKACLAFKYANEKKTELERIAKKIDEKKEQLDKTQQKINATQSKIIELDKQIQEITDHIEETAGVTQEKLFKEIGELHSSNAVLNVRIENCKNQLEAIKKRIEQLKNDEIEISKQIERLEKEKEKTVEKIGIDIGSFREEVLNAASVLKDTGEKFTKIFGVLLEQIRQRKETLDNLIKQNKIKQISEETNALVYSLEESLKEFNALAKNASKISERIAKLKIGTNEERNIVLEIELARKELERIKDIIKKSIEESKYLEELMANLKEEQNKRKKDIEEKEKLEKKIRNNFDKLLVKKSQLQGEVKKQEVMLKEYEATARIIENEINTLNIMKAKVEAEYDSAKVDCSAYEDLKEQLEKISLSKAELEARIARNEKALEEMGPVNLRALEVYDKVKAEYDEIAAKAAKIEEEKQEILKIIEEVDKKKKQAFMKAFNTINESFSQNFAALSNKGQAFLELENKQDPFAGGLDIIIKIAKGKERSADALSGGEKVIVALALIFAIQKYKPYCFYIFDEIDPALDKRNSEILANILKENIKDSQCIIITHNDAIINSANILYGTSMQEGISRIVSLKL